MKILVTGGAGYIGGTVARLLLERGHTVVVYDNLCHARRSMVPAGATFVEGDVADSKRLEAILADGSVAGVMHFAALIEAGESMRHPENYFRNNTAATLVLLETMVKNNLRRLVFSSTAAVYGEPVSTPIAEDAGPGSHQCIWGIQAAGGANASLDAAHSWIALCKLALLQRCGRDCGPRGRP